MPYTRSNYCTVGSSNVCCLQTSSNTVDEHRGSGKKTVAVWEYAAEIERTTSEQPRRRYYQGTTHRSDPTFRSVTK